MFAMPEFRGKKRGILERLIRRKPDAQIARELDTSPSYAQNVRSDLRRRFGIIFDDSRDRVPREDTHVGADVNPPDEHAESTENHNSDVVGEGFEVEFTSLSYLPMAG